MTSYFRTDIDKDYSKKPATKIRWKKTLEFIGNNSNFKIALDIGDRTGLTEMMENEYGVNFVNSVRSFYNCAKTYSLF